MRKPRHTKGFRLALPAAALPAAVLGFLVFAQTAGASDTFWEFTFTLRNETELGLALEREQASGAGLFFPVTNRAFTVRGGVIDRADAATNGFSATFLNALTPSDFNGVEIFPVTLRTRDVDGVIEFANAASNTVHTLPPTAGAAYSPGWIADLHGVPDVPTNGISQSSLDLMRHLLLPSHVEMTFHFIDATNRAAYAEAWRGTWNPPDGTASDGPGGLRFTSIAVDSNAVHLALAWPDGLPLPGGLLDILHTPDLALRNARDDIAWQPLARIPVEPSAGAVSNSIPLSLFPQEPEETEAGGIIVTNTLESLYAPGVAYTNTAAPFAQGGSVSAFFLAASLVDTDGDGLSDALERFVYGTDPDNHDTDGVTVTRSRKAGIRLQRRWRTTIPMPTPTTTASTQPFRRAVYGVTH